MGYSHYSYHTEPFSDTEWAILVDALDDLIGQAIKDGIDISADDGTTSLSAHERLNRAWIRDFGNGPVAFLNGSGQGAYETFCVAKNGNATASTSRNADGFSSCKTAYKPYDAFVVAALIWIDSHYPDRLKVSSDGTRSDWSAGMELARRAFPGASLEYPSRIAV